MQLIILLIFGITTALIASSKGRSGIGWFFVGFFTGLIGLILILCLSDLNAEKQKHEHLQNEQRRLREQLRQERMRSAAFQQFTNERLDTHDQHLQVDTRAHDAPAALESTEPVDAEVVYDSPPQNKFIYRKEESDEQT